jgi:hypothetical protein
MCAGISAAVIRAGRKVADFEQRRRYSALVAERPRSVVPVRRPDHGGELQREGRHIRSGQTARVDRQARRQDVESRAGR